MRPLATSGHDPSNRLAAMALAQEYGSVLYTGVFYRDPDPGLTFEQAAAERQIAHRAPREASARVLDLFAVN